MKTPRYDLVDWTDIADDFNDANLVLGNGFSIGLESSFRYDSLFDEFCTSIPIDAAGQFRQFGTTNFELIQAKLDTARRVNAIVGLPTLLLDERVSMLRDGLIQTIERVHPRSDERNRTRMIELTIAMEMFHDIFPLNYDLYSYDIIMLARDRYERGECPFRYNDLFWGDSDGRDKKFMGKNEYANYHDVFYPHGSLFLYRDNMDETYKVIRDSTTELIDVVAQRIRSGNMPLFVAEGTAQDKVRAIRQSNYLRVANNRLANAPRSYVVYGASLGTSDKHIVVALKHRKRAIAISIFPGNRNDEQLQREMYRLMGMFRGLEVSFFDSRTLFP